MAARTVAPFQYPGSKHRIASLVWQYLGHDVPRYIEPFAGSLGVLLARPGSHDGRGEVINDADGFVVNAWRAIRHDPAGVAWWLAGPATTADLNARHRWVHTEGRDRVAAVFTDPSHYDIQTAAWWVYGINVAPHPRAWTAPTSNAGGGSASGARANLKLVGHLADWRQPIDNYLSQLAGRLSRTIILAGEWWQCVTPALLQTRCGGSVNGTVAVFLDPPYTGERRNPELYGKDSGTVATDALAWCRTYGDHPQIRICLAGYRGEHDVLEDEGWTVEAWSSAGGGESRHSERLWFSPSCLRAENLLAGMAPA